jgi:hypothetical protein
LYLDDCSVVKGQSREKYILPYLLPGIGDLLFFIFVRDLKSNLLGGGVQLSGGL